MVIELPHRDKLDSLSVAPVQGRRRVGGSRGRVAGEACAFALLMRERREDWDLGCSCPNSFKCVSYKCRVSESVSLTKKQTAECQRVQKFQKWNLSSFTSVILFPHPKISNAAWRQFS